MYWLRLHMLLFEHPADRPLVVREHLSDSLVVHLLGFELFGEKLVLLADFLFVSHTTM